MVPPLEPRDAFFGGRTGATTLYAKTSEGEDISYQDFTSLYPWVNKYGTYPVRFPEIIYNPADQNIFHYFGIAQVDILAPERLFLPILPFAGLVSEKRWPNNSQSGPICVVTLVNNECYALRGVLRNFRRQWRKDTRSRKFMRSGISKKRTDVLVCLLTM